MKHLFAILLLGGFSLSLAAQPVRERILIDDDWLFALGNAASPEKDFGCGTEYFNYLTKAASIHNEGPYSPKFEPERWGVEWRTVNLPHDWVVDLPFAREASHSHGYKTVGFRYPESSVGWYRKRLSIPQEDCGKHLYLQFDGIFRDARVWFNGFYLGHEPSGYATQVYDITEYVNYGGENLIAVRADATLEEGWFYEGAGIYRHVWLCKTAPLHVAPFGTFVHSELNATYDKAVLTIETTVENAALESAGYTLRHTLIDAEGNEVAACEATETAPLLPKSRRTTLCKMTVDNPRLWSTEIPYIYTVSTEVAPLNPPNTAPLNPPNTAPLNPPKGGTGPTNLPKGEAIISSPFGGVEGAVGGAADTYKTRTGIRDIRFDADKGFFLNGQPLKLKGVNMHQDHAGVGTGLPDALQLYRLKELKKLGCNAYRSSHNPMTPEMLDAADSLGILVIEENRLTGINEEHIRLLRRMMERDRNHPCIILWSVGNEEWGIEWNEQGSRICATMREYCHRFDPTRPMTVATSSGPAIVVPADVAGYNYILQNPVEQHRRDYPGRKAIGSEETSGCSTRGIYFDDPDKGWMAAHNRKPNGPDSLLNCIERGWKFYDARPYLSGLFYWTGFDYRGEPNPMKFPATGSQFGILDYCGFPKDEAFYLKAWWTDEPVLHLLPHWNLAGHEGDSVSVWAYGNCDEVELYVNGKNLGRKPMPRNGHLEWPTVYHPGSLRAVGYKNGKKLLTEKIETTGEPARIVLTADRTTFKADGRDVAVCRVELQDKKQRFVPTACLNLTITVAGPVRILGVGNGNPAYQSTERPADANARTYAVRTFNGLAQILLQSTGEEGEATLTVTAENLPPTTLTCRAKK